MTADFAQTGHYRSVITNVKKSINRSSQISAEFKIIPKNKRGGRNLPPSAYSSIGAIGAIGTGLPQNGGLQILYIWSNLDHFGKHLNISFQNFTFY